MFINGERVPIWYASPCPIIHWSILHKQHLIFFYHHVQEANVPVSYVYFFINGKDNPSDVLRKYWIYIIIRRTSYGEQVNMMVGHNYRWRIQQQHKLMLASTCIIILALVLTMLVVQLIRHIFDTATQQLTVPVLRIIIPTISEPLHHTQHVNLFNPHMVRHLSSILVSTNDQIQEEVYKTKSFSFSFIFCIRWDWRVRL